VQESPEEERAIGAGSKVTGKGVLWGILALGVGVRGIGLGGAFWVDEVDSVVNSVRLPLRRLVTTYASENQHPLYSLLAKGSVGLFGESEWAARLPAVVMGVASLAAVARLGAQGVDPASGLLAALLLAVSGHHVWFSQNARGYTGLLLFTLLATSELFVLLRRAPHEPWRGAAARYALWCGLAAYTHLTAVFAFAGHAIAWVAFRAESRVAGRKALLAMASGALVTLLLYAPILGDVVRAFTARVEQASVQVVRVEPWTRPWWAIRQAVEGFGLGAWSLAGGAVAAALGCAGVASIWRRGGPGGRFLVLAHLAAAAAGLLVLVGLRRHLYPRFFLFEAGFAALAIVQGARAAGDWIACRRGCAGESGLGISFALAAAAGFALTLLPVYAHPKQDFVGARDFVEAQAAPGDAKVAVGPAKLALPGYYAPTWKTADTAEELSSLRRAAPRAWVVYTLPEQLRAARPDVAEALARDFQIVRELPGSLGGGTVYVARSR
jgi:4-amino-4-deoxy-L-arabinose transferase-like glycosyltransferase